MMIYFFCGVIFVAVVFGGIVIRECVVYVQKLALECARLRKNNQILNKWCQIDLLQDSIGKYLHDMGCGKVAIYGAGMYGKRLLRDLEESQFVEVSYFIDRVVEKVNGDLQVYNLQDEFPDVDAVIITPIANVPQIENDLRKKLNCCFIALDDLLMDI